LRDIFELFIPTVENYCCYLVWVCVLTRGLFAVIAWQEKLINTITRDNTAALWS